MDITDKQNAFEYRSPADLYIHGEPLSPAQWNKRLLEIGGRCDLGDPLLRIVWGGTAKKRGYVQTESRSVEAMVIKYPGPIPKVRQLGGFAFHDDSGRTVNVTRQDQIPDGKLCHPRYDYIELGQLRWILERKFTPEQLVLMQMFPAPDSPQAKTFGVRGKRRYAAPMDTRGEYVGLYPLETPDGKYWEPDELWFDAMAKTVYEAKNATEADKRDLFDEHFDRLERMEEKREEARLDDAETIFENALIETESAPQGQVYFS